MSVDQLTSFEEAFSDRVSGCRRTCECGREFWDGYNSGYDWEEEEVEELEQDPKATRLNYAVSVVTFEGRYYVLDCDCWKERAKRIIAWLDAHADSIADYLRAERKRKEQAAAASPVV